MLEGFKASKTMCGRTYSRQVPMATDLPGGIHERSGVSPAATDLTLQGDELSIKIEPDTWDVDQQRRNVQSGAKNNQQSINSREKRQNGPVPRNRVATIAENATSGAHVVRISGTGEQEAPNRRDQRRVAVRLRREVRCAGAGAAEAAPLQRTGRPEDVTSAALVERTWRPVSPGTVAPLFTVSSVTGGRNPQHSQLQEMPEPRPVPAVWPSLALDHVDEDEDQDLTPLSWLQNKNLLRDIQDAPTGVLSPDRTPPQSPSHDGEEISLLNHLPVFCVQLEEPAEEPPVAPGPTEPSTVPGSVEPTKALNSVESTLALSSVEPTMVLGTVESSTALVSVEPTKAPGSVEPTIALDSVDPPEMLDVKSLKREESPGPLDDGEPPELPKDMTPAEGHSYCQKKHPSVYDPQVHISLKPPFSFSSLILMAIEGSKKKELEVREIYEWIQTQFPYYSKFENGWKNSIRHNLSLNPAFYKVTGGSRTVGKGCCKWKVDPSYGLNKFLEPKQQKTFLQGGGKRARKPPIRVVRTKDGARTPAEMASQHDAEREIRPRRDSTSARAGPRRSSHSVTTPSPSPPDPLAQPDGNVPGPPPAPPPKKRQNREPWRKPGVRPAGLRRCDIDRSRTGRPRKSRSRGGRVTRGWIFTPVEGPLDQAYQDLREGRCDVLFEDEMPEVWTDDESVVLLIQTSDCVHAEHNYCLPGSLRQRRLSEHSEHESAPDDPLLSHQLRPPSPPIDVASLSPCGASALATFPYYAVSESGQVSHMVLDVDPALCDRQCADSVAPGALTPEESADLLLSLCREPHGVPLSGSGGGCGRSPAAR